MHHQKAAKAAPALAGGDLCKNEQLGGTLETTNIICSPDIQDRFVAFTIPGEPVAFARSGGNGKIRFTPKRQRDFMALVKLAAHSAMDGAPPLDGPIELSIRAVYLVPSSWPKKRAATARWRTSKPDADNIAKLVSDAVNEIVFVDDAQVASLIVQKVYGPIAGVTVSGRARMSSPLAPIVSKIAAILPRFASEHDGEVIASVRAVDRVLHSNKSDWHDFAKTFARGVAVSATAPPNPLRTPPTRTSRAPTWAASLHWERECLLVMLGDQSWLSPWERTFIESLKIQRPRSQLSPRQIAVIDRLLAHAFANRGGSR